MMMHSPFVMLTAAALKGYLRNRAAVFWNLLVPIAIMSIFALLSFGNVAVGIGVVDQAQNDVSAALLDNLRHVSAVTVDAASDLEQQRRHLESGKIDLLVVLPAGLGKGPSALPAFYSQGSPQRSQVALTIMNRFLDQASFQTAGVQPAFTLAPEPVQSKTVSYIDFVVPGMIALTIQQTGLFSVATVLVALKQWGVLRRMMATPMRALDFLSSQVISRVVVTTLQAAILLAVGLFLLNFHFYGNLLYLLLLALLGSGIFIAIGFAISGYARTAETAAPLVNLIALPLMFLSGIFFPRSVMPGWLQTITQYSPLSFLADGLRSISVDGASLWAIRLDVAGIIVWLVISVFVATRLFRWE